MENQNPQLPPNDPYSAVPTPQQTPVDRTTRPTFEPTQPITQPVVQQPGLPPNAGIMVEGGVDNIAPEVATGSHRGKKLLIFVIGGLLVVGVLTSIVILAVASKKGNPTHPTAVSGGTNRFTSTDKTIGVSFPKEPVAVKIPSTIPGTKIKALGAEAWTYRPNRSLVYGLVEMHIPRGTNLSTSSITQAAASNGKVLASQNTTLGGLPASQVTAKFTRDNVALYTTIVATIKNDTVYIMSYASNVNDSQTASSFINSATFL